jgi:hypothetical protein
MIDAGLLPPTLSGKLSGLADYFNINSSQAHTADGDVLMTLSVYESMLELMRNGKR